MSTRKTAHGVNNKVRKVPESSYQALGLLCFMLPLSTTWSGIPQDSLYRDLRQKPRLHKCWEFSGVCYSPMLTPESHWISRAADTSLMCIYLGNIQHGKCCLVDTWVFKRMSMLLGWFELWVYPILGQILRPSELPTHSQCPGISRCGHIW